MEYQVLENKIIINDCKDFNIEHILECGQIFTYKKTSDLCYEVYSKDKFAAVKFIENKYVITTDNPEYFVDFFDLKTDYSKIKSTLGKDKNVVDAINYGYGIRILKQDILEVVIGFIISANNNIERIKKIMQKLREFGTNYGNYYGFPNLEQLSKITEEQFKQIGAGYRAKYLVTTVQQLKNIDIQKTFLYDTSTLKNWLLSLCGVGPKVADCILLFGYKRAESFPVDTWIEKVYFDIFKTKKSRQKMSEDLVNYFKDLSGYAQQYLFFYKRNFSNIYQN